MEPTQKATMSVTDVIVIEIPLCFMVFPIRVSMSSLVEVDANPDSNTNISSTPIPKNIKNKINNQLRHKSNIHPSPTFSAHNAIFNNLHQL